MLIIMAIVPYEKLNHTESVCLQSTDMQNTNSTHFNTDLFYCHNLLMILLGLQ